MSEATAQLERYAAKRRTGERGALRHVDTAFRLEADPAWPRTLKPSQPAAAPLLAYRGHALVRAGKAADGLAKLQQALKLEPAGWIAAWLGEALRQAGRPQEAAAAFEQAIGLDARYANAWAWRATLRLSTGDASGALSDLDRALRLQPTARAHMDRARALRALGRVSESLDALEAASRLNPELGWGSLPEIDAAATVAPDERRLEAWRGEALLRSGKPEDARAALLRAGDWAWASAWLAEAELACGEPARALTCATAALRRDRGYARAHWAKAAALERLGRDGEALKCHADGLKLYPYSARALLARARVQDRLRRRAAARRDAQRALRLSPGFKDAAAFLSGLAAAALLMIAMPARAAEARPEIAVDARLELISVVDALAGVPRGAAAFGKGDYAKAAKARFAAAKDHRAVTAYRAAAAQGMDFASALRLVMQAPAATTPSEPKPDPKVATGEGKGPGGPGPGSVFGPKGPGPGSVHLSTAQAQLLEALQAFRADTGFDAFFAEQKPRNDAMIADVRRQAAERDAVGMMEDYTGETIAAAYSVLLCPLCREPEAANVLVSEGGRVHVYSTLGPPFDYAEARLALWHELAHTLLDPLQAGQSSKLKDSEPLFETVADCCRGSWQDCVREHTAQGLAYAVWRKSGSRTLKQKKEPAYINEVAARFKELEAGRASGLKLTAFYPRLLEVFSELRASSSGKRSSACTSKTRF